MADRKMKRPKTANDNSDSLNKKMTKPSLDRINGWLEDQYERHQKPSSITDSEWYENESNLDPDDPSEQEDNSAADGGRKRSAFQYSKEVYEMKCEWAECDHVTTKVDDFVSHVAGHLPQTEQRDTGTLFCCLWDSCGFDSKEWSVVVRHINYHSFHTKIKAIGSSIMKRSKLPDCNLDYAGRNLLPVLPVEMNCEWDECNHECDNFQKFLDHVQCHVHVLPSRGANRTPKKIVCEWRDCQKTFNDWHKLREHVRTHTQEKLVGCPVCGTQFSNKTKFYDHCKRQMPNDKKGFKCSHCRKNFATERTLRDHIRLHVNLFKCPMCDMTCPFQSTLALHIRYRHLDLKPFQCSFCEHRSKTQRDLENHQLTHCSENFWVCEQEDCDYSCRSKNVLQEHYAKNHTEDMDLCLYHCHICTQKYKRGADLTVHLKKEHSYRWASGHSRFKYIRGDDGIYRLQTVRYESIEVTKEMMKGKTSKMETIPKKKYKCTFESLKSVVVKEVEEGEEEEEEEEQGKEGKEREVEKEKRRDEGGEEGKRNSVNEENIERKETEVETSPSATDVQPDPDPADPGPTDLATIAEESSSDSSTFEESLKKYLGLTGTSNFIKVVKNNKDKL